MFDLLTEMPLVALFLKFMIASTVLLGAVWGMEKADLINRPDMAELAWKAAIVGSFLSLVPVADFMSSTFVVENQRTASFIEQLNAERPLIELAAPAKVVISEVVNRPAERTIPTSGSPAPEASPAPAPFAAAELRALERAVLEDRIETQTTNIAADNARSPIVFDSEGDSETIIKPTFWQSAATLRTMDIAVLGWVGLALLAIIALLVSYRAAVKNLGSRKRVEAEGHANKMLRSICEQADIRHVPYLSRSSDLKSPVCLPRKEICLPDWAFDDMPEAEFKSLLAHELGHMVRRDPIMLMALQVLSRIFFFQPLFILARKRLTDIAELAADEWAAKQASDSRAVANALFICATKIHETRQIQWGLAMAGNKSILKRRVERLMSAQSVPFKTTGTVAKSALAIGVIGLGLGMPSIEFAGAHPPENVHEREVYVTHETDGYEYQYVAGLEESISVMVSSAMEAAADAVSMAEHGDLISHSFDDDDSGSINWHEDDYSVSISWEGSFSIGDRDDTIIANDDYGFMRIKTNEDGEKRLIKFEGDDGKTTSAYYKAGKKQEMDADGQKWLKRTIGKLIETGFGAEDRVKRILKNKGVKGVLAEVKDFESDMAKRFYISHLISEATLKDKEIEQVVNVVGTMDSDFEMRLTLSHLLEEEKVSDKALPKVLNIVKKMDSDFEKRLLVTHYVSKLKLTNKSADAVVAIAETMDSDFELRLMLTAALSDTKISDKNVAKIFDLAVNKIDSDFEMRLLMTSFADQMGNSNKVVAKVLTAVEKMDSDFEQRLLLSTLVHKAELNEKNWLEAIKVADSIDSDHEKSLVLRQMRGKVPEKNKKVMAALDEAMKDVRQDYALEELEEYERELTEQLQEAEQEREEAIREALQGHNGIDHEFIQREAMKAQVQALREVEKELVRVKRDQTKAKGTIQRELARAARELERAKRELERAFSKETIVTPDEPAEPKAVKGVTI